MNARKLAAVSFLNARPITYGLEHGLGDDRFELSFELPSRCAELLERGDVDLGLIPSASYAAALGRAAHRPRHRDRRLRPGAHGAAGR